MEQKNPADQPKADPAEIARVFGVDELSNKQAGKWEAALLKRAQEILAARLYEVVPPEDHPILDKCLVEGDKNRIRELLQRLFKDYDELERESIVDARNEIISRAAQLQLEESDDPTTGPE